MATPVKSPKRKARRACVFCGESGDDEDMFGKLLSKANLTAHYFCMLFASGLSQNGKSEKKGILGFLPSDITKEVRRAARLRCSYCKKVGATIGCVMKNCKKMFHLGCGRRNDTLHQFFDTFCSYCPSHRPQQDVVASVDPSGSCSICMAALTPAPGVDTLQAPCCKRDWYHRTCIQRYANSAGLYFFKCPLCNNKEDFQHTMLTFGIYIPDQDASWETEPHAFQDLLERYRHCDAAVCKCAEGRKYDKDGTKWEIILCEDCGSAGSHVACGHLVKVRKRDLCTECYAVDQKVKLEKKMMKKQTPEKRKSLEMPFLEPALSPEGEKQAGSQYPGPSGKMRKKGLPQPGQMSPEYTCPLLSPQDKGTVSSPRMKMTPKSKSLSGGNKKGKRESVSGNISKVSKASKSKTKCETQTYAMYTAERSNTVDTDTSDDEMSLKEIKRKIKGSGKFKSSGAKKRYSEILPGASTDTGDKLTSAGGTHRRESLPGVKRKYKKRKSGDPDSSQTSITRWFKARPVDNKRLSLPSDSSQTSIIKWFKNRSSKLDSIGSQPISQPVVPHQSQTKTKPYKRPKTVEWKGKQLLIKSPRVVLKKDSRLGKIKPRNLTIDMNDRKGSDGDLLDMLDTDVRLTRNTVLADIPVKKPKNLIIDMNNQKDQDLLTMIDSDVRLTRNKVQTDILPMTTLSSFADVSPRKRNVTKEGSTCGSPSKIEAVGEMKEITTQTPVETELELPTVGQSQNKEEELESNYSKDSEITFSMKNKVTKPISSDVQLEMAGTESPSRSKNKRGRKSTASRQAVTATSSQTSTHSTFSSAESAVSTDLCTSNHSPRPQKLGHKKEGIRLYFEAEVNNNKVNDSPAKNLRNLKKRSIVEEDHANMPEDDEDFIMVDTSDENSSVMSNPAILKLKEMLHARVEKLSDLTEAEINPAKTLSPLRNRDESSMTAGPGDGEHTPTSQIHKAFDFSVDKVDELNNNSSPNMKKKNVKFVEAACSGHKLTNKMDNDKVNQVAISDVVRRSPRTGPKSCEKQTSGVTIQESQLQKPVLHKTGVTILDNDKVLANSEEGKNQPAVGKVKAMCASHSPRSSPRLKSADSARVASDKPDSTSSPVLRKRGLWLQNQQEALKRKLETDEDADVTPSKRPVRSKPILENVAKNEDNSVAESLDLNKVGSTPTRLVRSRLNKNTSPVRTVRTDKKDGELCVVESLVGSKPARDSSTLNRLSLHSVASETSTVSNVEDAAPGSFTKITPRRSPRKHAEAEKCTSPAACKGLDGREGVGKSQDTLSLLKAYKMDERLMKTKLADSNKQGRADNGQFRSDNSQTRSDNSQTRSDSQGKCDKVLRMRTRASLPGGASCNNETETGKSVVWVLPGTRQITAEKSVSSSDKSNSRLSENVFEAPSQENTNPNINASPNSIHNSLPLKKRKFISKLETNSDIRDFLGKSHSMFFDKPDGLSRSNSECSDVGGVSDICTTALKLSPSYVTRFRRCHSRDGSDISQSVIQNLSTFSNEDDAQNTDKQNGSTAGTQSASDRIAMTDYYKGPKSIVRARRSMESMASFNSDDSDLMIISPIVGQENIIEIV